MGLTSHFDKAVMFLDNSAMDGFQVRSDELVAGDIIGFITLNGCVIRIDHRVQHGFGNILGNGPGQLSHT